MYLRNSAFVVKIYIWRVFATNLTENNVLFRSNNKKSRLSNWRHIEEGVKGIALPCCGVQHSLKVSVFSLITQERLNVVAFFTVIFFRCQCPFLVLGIF